MHDIKGLYKETNKRTIKGMNKGTNKETKNGMNRGANTKMNRNKTKHFTKYKQ